MAFKMAPRSPLMKSLKGGQKNLPEGLKKAIEAAPGKMMDSPAKMGRGERYDVKMASDQNLTAGARKNYAENAEAAQKSSPAKNMNKGYGSPAKETDPKKAAKAKARKANKTLISKEVRNPVGGLNVKPAPKTPKLASKKPASKSKKIAGSTDLRAERKNTAAKGAAAKASRKADGDKKPMPPTGDSPAKNMNKGYGSPAKKSRKETIADNKAKQKKAQEVRAAQRAYKSKVGSQEMKGVKPNSPEEKIAMKNIDERVDKNRRK